MGGKSTLFFLILWDSLSNHGGPVDVPRSCSVHQRHIYGPEGNQQNAKVRMSNRLVKNFVVWLELLARHRKFWFVVEQPTSSWLFKMQALVSIMAAMACVKVTTWKLGSFGHTGFLMVWFWNLLGVLLISYIATSIFSHEFCELLIKSKDGILFSRSSQTNTLGWDAPWSWANEEKNDQGWSCQNRCETWCLVVSSSTIFVSIWIAFRLKTVCNDLKTRGPTAQPFSFDVYICFGLLVCMWCGYWARPSR